MSADSSRQNALGYFDPERMVKDYGAVKASFDIEDYDVNSAYSNEFLDMNIKMP